MMKKRHILHWAMGVMMTPLLGSCAADDVVGDAGREGCDIILGPAITVTSVTRATDGRTSSNQFEQDEIVWLWAKKTTDGSEYIKAWQLTAQSGGSFNGTTKYWPSDGSKLDVYAIHGNFKDSQITADNTQWSSLSLTHTVEDDQSLNDKKRLSDLLYAKRIGATHSNNVELTFDHLLAMITVKLDLSNSQGITDSELANATVTLTNILPEATISSSSLAGTSGQTSTTGSRTTIIAGKPTSVSNGAVIGSAIVPLQDFGGGKSPSSNNVITITLTDGRTFSYQPSNNFELKKGKEYIYTLRIINGELSVSSISVKGFTEETTEEKKWEIYEDTSS